MSFKKVPGTRDILPEEVIFWQRIEDTARKVFNAYNFREIRTPIIENVLVFNRSLGEFAEIVQKQMFLIKNKEDTYCLRPEGTAAIVRAYLENNFDKTNPFQKFYYLGPMFRLERPQKGRLRQFHHIGAEIIGSDSPAVDVEIISLADSLLRKNGVTGYELQINTLGCAKDKKALVKLLEKELSGKSKGLCEDCQVRLKTNILRILDCKNEPCKKIVSGLNLGDKHLCEECLAHFSKVKDGLEDLKIEYTVAPHLVRGLDYYTRTVFEFKHSELGAQDAVGAGGRYDNLVHEMGGPQTGAMGFALGVERLLLATNVQSQKIDGQNLVYIIALGEQAKPEAVKILDNLRKAGVAADTDYENKSLKGAMRQANDLAAKLVLILGDNELAKKTIMLKDMQSGTQEEIPLDNLIEKVKARC
ncbi:MAG: histidine--tRNA ligase [Candidatus Omnitrophica bacterium]|nr:histidine--tRNA ligase [Candidatus Omnitrophota bacterium]MDD5653380.1 histidine--tRNA ligase [Candidatus Omnitrophota bacterium]